MITLAAFVLVLVLSPFLTIYERMQRFRLLPPLEQELRRASQGMAVAVLTFLFAYGFFGVAALKTLIPNLAASPLVMWPPVIVIGGLIAGGLVRSVLGIRRIAGHRDPALAARALLKFAAGAAATVYLWRMFPLTMLVVPDTERWWLLPLFAVGVWCLVTGFVRFAVLSVANQWSSIARARDMLRNPSPTLIGNTHIDPYLG